MIFAYFPQQARPWIGAYTPQTQDNPHAEWVPMSWCPDGTFIMDKVQDREIINGADIPELDKLRHDIHDT